MTLSNNPIEVLLKEKKVIILDGALATELETRGLDLSSSLWSAKVLQENPNAVYDVHLDYFLSGADVAITASYQATPLGLKQHLDMSAEESHALIGRSVKLAIQARDAAMKQLDAGKQRKLLIAGSVGPYGAYLADGSEYRGDYKRSATEFKDFHRGRIAALVDAKVDILACETMPSLPELEALLDLLATEFPSTPAWVAVTLRSATELSDGTPMQTVLDLVSKSEQVVAVGLNCVPEQDVTPALDAWKHLTSKPLIVYPNSGETWNAEQRAWSGKRAEGREYADVVRQWIDRNVRLIGGCCRTGPKDIAAICDTLEEN